MIAGPPVDVVPLFDFGTPAIAFSEPTHGIIEMYGTLLSGHAVGESQIEFKILAVTVSAVQSSHSVFHRSI